MERFDDQLKRLAREEDAPLPDWAAGCIQDALDSLPEKRKKHGIVLKYFGTALAACLAVFIALPNLSAQAADSMRAIPVVGELVELVTFRTYVKEDEYHQMMVEIPTVEARLIGEKGYIRITTCNDVTPDQFGKALNEMLNNGATSLIFDVRDNGGGTIDAAAKVLDTLLPEGPIVSATYKDGTTEVLAESDGGYVYSTPMVVLVNEKTASAAELFAQALKDYGMARCVGTTTFGKGKIQQLFTLNDGSAINLTVGTFNPPYSSCFDGVGVKPDYEVALQLEDGTTFDDLEEEEDAQLQRAIAVLDQMLLNDTEGSQTTPQTESASESSESTSSESSSEEEDAAA